MSSADSLRAYIGRQLFPENLLTKTDHIYKIVLALKGDEC